MSRWPDHHFHRYRSSTFLPLGDMLFARCQHPDGRVCFRVRSRAHRVRRAVTYSHGAATLHAGLIRAASRSSACAHGAHAGSSGQRGQWESHRHCSRNCTTTAPSLAVRGSVTCRNGVPLQLLSGSTVTTPPRGSGRCASPAQCCAGRGVTASSADLTVRSCVMCTLSFEFDLMCL